MVYKRHTHTAPIILYLDFELYMSSCERISELSENEVCVRKMIKDEKRQIFLQKKKFKVTNTEDSVTFSI